MEDTHFACKKDCVGKGKKVCEVVKGIRYILLSHTLLLFMYMQSVYPPFPDDHAWIGVETSKSKKVFRLQIVTRHSDIIIIVLSFP